MSLIRIVRAGSKVKVGFMGTRDQHGRYVPLNTPNQKSDGIFLANAQIGDWVVMQTGNNPTNVQDN
jgi:hypothetical protein